MEPEQVLNSLNKTLIKQEERSLVSIGNIRWGVDNMENLQVYNRTDNALESVRQEISNLLNDKEQKMNGTVITSKIHLPNKELVGVKKSEEKRKKIQIKFLTQQGWRLLVLPFKMDGKN